MSKSPSRPASLAVSTVLASGLTLAGSAFAMQPLAQGYLISAQDAAAAATDAKASDKKGEEGKCGLSKADTDKDGKVSRAEFDAAHPGKGEKFTALDTNKDGSIDATEAKAHKEGKCGEGKCGEGKCGGSA